MGATHYIDTLHINKHLGEFPVSDWSKPNHLWDVLMDDKGSSKLQDKKHPFYTEFRGFRYMYINGEERTKLHVLECQSRKKKLIC